MLRLLVLSSFLIATLGAEPVRAEHEAALDGPHFTLKLTLGWAGEVHGGVRTTELDPSSASRSAILRAPLNVRDPFGWETGGSGLEPSYGMAGQYVWPLLRYFALGAQLGLFAWRTEMHGFGNARRNLAFDLAVVPEGRLPVLQWFELYLALPLGATLDVFNQGDRDSSQGTSVALEGTTAVGFTGSVLVGARFALSGRLGVLVELGYTRRWIPETMNVSVAGRKVETAKSDLQSWQLLSNVGVFY
jgi:hypothetical protein